MRRLNVSIGSKIGNNCAKAVGGIMFTQPQCVSTAHFNTAAQQGKSVCFMNVSQHSMKRFTQSAKAASFQIGASTSATASRFFSTSSQALAPKKNESGIAAYSSVPQEYKEEPEQNWEEEQQEKLNEEAYLPFPPPFHTVNIVGVLFVANVLCYLIMNYYDNDDVRDFMVEHCTLSHENYHRIYPFFTYAIYQENLLQLAIDCWLLWQFGNTMLGFLGGKRMAVFWAMTSVGGGLLHVGRQFFELHYGIDPLEVRGRCYGPNPFILGLVGVEGLIFRHLNFMQNPPVPFLVLTAFVMVIDVWRIFTTKPEEHGAPTGGALVAYIFWRLPTRMMGLDGLTAAL